MKMIINILIIICMMVFLAPTIMSSVTVSNGEIKINDYTITLKDKTNKLIKDVFTTNFLNKVKFGAYSKPGNHTYIINSKKPLIKTGDDYYYVESNEPLISEECYVKYDLAYFNSLSDYKIINTTKCVNVPHPFIRIEGRNIIDTSDICPICYHTKITDYIYHVLFESKSGFIDPTFEIENFTIYTLNNNNTASQDDEILAHLNVTSPNIILLYDPVVNTTKAFDFSESGHDGTFENVTWLEGESAWKFNKNSSYVEIDNHADFMFGTSRSHILRLNFTSGYNLNFFVLKRTNWYTGSYYDFTWYTASTGIRVHSGMAGDTITSNAIPSNINDIGVIAYNSTRFGLYMNSTFKGNGSWAPWVTIAGARLGWGDLGGIDGNIYKFAVWDNRTLTPNEISDFYNGNMSLYATDGISTVNSFMINETTENRVNLSITGATPDGTQILARIQSSNDNSTWTNSDWRNWTGQEMKFNITEGYNYLKIDFWLFSDNRVYTPIVQNITIHTYGEFPQVVEYCDSCANCTSLLEHPLVSEVVLVNDISTTDSCINNPTSDGKTLNCNGYAITGDHNEFGVIGVLNFDNFVMRNCSVGLFYYNTLNLGCDNWTIEHSNFYDGDIGDVVDQGYQSVVRYNHFTNTTDYGILISTNDNMTVYNNTFPSPVNFDNRTIWFENPYPEDTYFQGSYQSGSMINLLFHGVGSGYINYSLDMGSSQLYEVSWSGVSCDTSAFCNYWQEGTIVKINADLGLIPSLIMNIYPRTEAFPQLLIYPNVQKYPYVQLGEDNDFR